MKDWMIPAGCGLLRGGSVPDEGAAARLVVRRELAPQFAQDTSFHDAPLVGHETGHGFGSPRAHCYTPPIDTCYNGRACYTGSRSCPAPVAINGVTNVTGMVMSYCHLSGSGSTAVFHPRTVALIAPKIQARVGQCIFQLGPVNSVFSDDFETGTTASWH
jgi:hypothetical protein